MEEEKHINGVEEETAPVEEETETTEVKNNSARAQHEQMDLTPIAKHRMEKLKFIGK